MSAPLTRRALALFPWPSAADSAPLTVRLVAGRGRRTPTLARLILAALVAALTACGGGDPLPDETTIPAECSALTQPCK